MVIELFKKLFNIGKKRENLLKLSVKNLPSQGYFYPKGLEINIKKGDSEDQKIFNNTIDKSNIIGVIESIIFILKRRLRFNIQFDFNSLRAIDILYIFIEFIKYTNTKEIYFNTIKFDKENFLYFGFSQYKKFYDNETKEFVFGNWRYSLPSIGVETSLSKFSYEVSMNGETEIYKNKNYNLIYFLGDRNLIGFEYIKNLTNLIEDLPEEDVSEISDVVDKFSDVSLYYLVEVGKVPTKITYDMIKEMWKDPVVI